MSKFKAGDKVKMLETCSSAVKGKVYELKEHQGSLYANLEIEKTDIIGCFCEHKWELVKETNIPKESYDKKWIYLLDLLIDIISKNTVYSAGTADKLDKLIKEVNNEKRN